MEIRKAELKEMDQVMKLVCDIFEGQGIPREMNFIPAERDPQWWIVHDPESQTVIGAIAAYTSEGERHMGRFVIDEAYRGRHLGSQLLQHAIEDSFAEGWDLIHTDSRDTTRDILLRMGATITGEPFVFFEGECTPMDIAKSEFHRIP